MKVVIFDVGGTLIGAKDLFLEAAKLLGRVDLQECLRDEFWKVVEKNSFLSEEQALLLASESIAELHGLDSSRIAGLGDSVFVKGSNLFDDVIETLSFLKDNNVLMLVASDSDYDLMVQELKKHNIFGFFKVVLTSSLVGAYKPSSVFVQRIKESVELHCANCDELFFVGDSDADVKTAIKLGAVPVFIGRQGQSHRDAKHNISSLSELMNIVN